MSYDINSVANVGIAFAWREDLYYNFKPSNCIGKLIKAFVYKFLSIFINDVPNYQFNDDIIKLNEDLKSSNFFYFSMIFLTILYYLIIIIVPYYVKVKNNTNTCSSGIHYYSHMVYFGFALICAVVELKLFLKVTKQIGYLLPDPMDDKKYDINKVYGRL